MRNFIILGINDSVNHIRERMFEELRIGRVRFSAEEKDTFLVFGWFHIVEKLEPRVNQACQMSLFFAARAVLMGAIVLFTSLVAAFHAES